MGARRPTVLVVDDDPVFLASLTAVLHTRYEVRTARNGTEALAAIDDEIPDAVILDVMMDHMSEGFDVARTLRGNDATSSVFIIILTGVDRIYNLRMEIDESWVPADRYLEKPISPEELLAEIRELIGPGHPRSADD